MFSMRGVHTFQKRGYDDLAETARVQRRLAGFAEIAANRQVSKPPAPSLMFTIEQLDDLHARLGSAKTFPQYVLALKGLGVQRYDSYLADGHSEYFGQYGHIVVSPPVHEHLLIAETGQRDTFLQHLHRHELRETTYLEMSRGLAQSGIEKWTVDTVKMTMTFYDKSGKQMLVEQIT
jgi:uncharacterized protein YbcV (DUF1398 family)